MPAPPCPAPPHVILSREDGEGPQNAQRSHSEFLPRPQLRMTIAAAFALVALRATALPCPAPILGADLTDISHSLRKSQHIPGYVAGALVRVVWAGGPAGLAGVSAGDVIQAVG